MKTYICIALAVASIALAGCAGNSTGSNTQSAVAGQPQSPPKGWVCPQHGDKCPWTVKRGYCQHYSQHGYGHCRGGGCCNW